LILSRLISYKQLDLAVEACRKLGRRLIVIGDGPDRKRLERLAGKETEFLGRQP
jgi:glycosyltransferase involved in cell wall biosynthesis